MTTHKKTERKLAAELGVSNGLVGRKRRQGKSDEQIAEEAATQRATAGPSQQRTESYGAAQARKEAALADLRELELQTKRGEVVPAEQVRAVWEGMVTTAKAKFLSIGDELSQALADETDPVRCREIVDGKVYAALGTLVAYEANA